MPCRRGCSQIDDFITNVETGVDAFTSIAGIIRDFALKVKDQPWAQNIANVATKALQVAGVVSDIIDKVQTYLDVAQKVLDIDNLSAFLREQVSSLLGLVTDKVDDIVDAVAAKLRSVVDFAANTLFGIIRKLEGFVQDGLNKVVTFIKSKLQPFTSVVARVRSKIGQFLDIINNGFDFTKLSGWIKDQIDAVVSKAPIHGVVVAALDLFDVTAGKALVVRCSEALLLFGLFRCRVLGLVVLTRALRRPCSHRPRKVPVTLSEATKPCAPPWCPLCRTCRSWHRWSAHTCVSLAPCASRPY